MNRLSDPELWEYIRQDLPYFDLTTRLLETPAEPALLHILTRHEVVAACTEEAGRIGELLGCRVRGSVASGETVEAGGVLLTLEGNGPDLHGAWRAAQILMEYACGIATYAARMRRAAAAENPHCEVFTTRKSFPFAKRFVVRALLCGGIMPHRLGLSETVLVFDKHRSLFADADVEGAFRALKRRCIEKKLVAEAESLEEAARFAEWGADVIQLDKCDAATLREAVALRDAGFPHLRLLAAGGVNLQNVAEYAATGVDGIVTSSPYQAAKAADLTARWERP